MGTNNTIESGKITIDYERKRVPKPIPDVMDSRGLEKYERRTIECNYYQIKGDPLVSSLQLSDGDGAYLLIGENNEIMAHIGFGETPKMPGLPNVSCTMCGLEMEKMERHEWEFKKFDTVHYWCSDCKVKTSVRDYDDD